MQVNDSRRIFYGWWVTLALLVMISVSHGIGYYVFPVILKPLTHEFGWNRSAVSWAVSIFSISLGIFGPLVGKLCDRHGARRVMLASLPVFATGLCLFGAIQSLWHLYAVYTVISVGVAGMHTVSVSSAITQWFSRKQGTAIGLAFSGISVGGLTQAPLAWCLFAQTGWRTSYVILAAISVVVIAPLLVFVVKNNPREVGAYPDGAPTGNETRRPVENPLPGESSPGRMLAVFKTPVFWTATLSFALVNVAFIGVLTHQVAFFTDMGISSAKAASALGYIAGFGILGKVGAGWLGDRISKIGVGILFFSLEGLSVVFLLAHSTALLWPFVIVFGISMGANAVVRPLVISELFGSILFGTIYGWAIFFSYFGLAIGAPLAGFIYDRSGSYQGAFIIFFIAYLSSVVLLLLLSWRRHRK